MAEKATEIKSALRHDIAFLEPLEPKDDGFLRAKVKMAKPGVFSYFRGDGVTLEAKLPEEILSVETIDSAKRAPSADGHPPLSDCKGLITADNYQKHVKGVLGDTIHVQDSYLVGEETIFDKALAESIKSGKKAEVSIGFTADIDPTPGEYNGKRYDAAQRNIRINHIAHVEKGRAGSDVKAFFDSADSKGVPVTRLDMEEGHTNDNQKSSEGDKTMNEDSIVEKILAGIKSMFASKDGSEPKKETTDMEDMQKKTDMSDDPDQQKLQKLMKENEELKAKLTKSEQDAKSKQDADELDKAIEERVSLLETARSLLDSFEHKGLTNRDIKLDVIESILPFTGSVNQDSLSDTEIDARFDAAKELAKEKAMLPQESSSNMNGARLDANSINQKRAERLNIYDQLEKEAEKGGVL